MTGRYLIYTPLESARDESVLTRHGEGLPPSAARSIETGSPMTCN
jgi:hypothetical protein